MTQKYSVGEEVVAVLVNPKTRELVEVLRHRQKTVNICYPGSRQLLSDGGAYWDESEAFEIDGDDYVRSHSPGAGVTVGKGYGVVLYAGLCLRAYSDASLAVGIASSDGGGHRSTRSRYATEFWERCVRNGLADETTIESSEQRTETKDYNDFSNGCYDVADEECTEVDDVSGEITLTYTASGGEVEVQYMKADKVAESGLIFAAPGVNIADFEFSPPSAEVLASLDLRHCYDVGLAEMLITHALNEGFDLLYVERMVRTLPNDVYRKTSVSKQLKFDFVSNAERGKVDKEIAAVWRDAYGSLVDM